MNTNDAVIRACDLLRSHTTTINQTELQALADEFRTRSEALRTQQDARTAEIETIIAQLVGLTPSPGPNE